MENMLETDFSKEVVIYKTDSVEIFKGRINLSGREIAVKKQKFDSIYDMNSIEIECDAMRNLQHPNIAEFIGCVLPEDNGNIEHFLIITDYYPNGNLQNLIDKTKLAGSHPFSEGQLFSYFMSLIDAHCFIQRGNYIHGCINPKNIWIDNDGSLKITNFSCASRLSISSRKINCPIRENDLFLSPKLRQARINFGKEHERLQHDPIKSDVYSLGLVFLYMASLRDLSDLVDLRSHENKVRERIQNISYSNKIKQILAQMLIFDEDRRPDFVSLFNSLSLMNINNVQQIQQARPQSVKLKAKDGWDWNNIIRGRNIKVLAKLSYMRSYLEQASPYISNEAPKSFIFSFIALVKSMNARIIVKSISYKCMICNLSNADGYFSCHPCGYFHIKCVKTLIYCTVSSNTRQYLINCKNCRKSTVLKEETISHLRSPATSLQAYVSDECPLNLDVNFCFLCSFCNYTMPELFFYSCYHKFCGNCLKTLELNCPICEGTCNAEEKRKFLQRNLK